MGDEKGFFDRIGDLFTGGLNTALEIEAERERADIENKRIAEDLRLARLDDSGRLYPAGQVTAIGVAGIPWTVVFGGISALAALVLLARRR